MPVKRQTLKVIAQAVEPRRFFNILEPGTSTKMNDQLPVYSKSQLALRNGQDKPEIWIAFKGLIYDVSASRLWRNGKHYEHWAGQDLTPELADAPHDEWVFQTFEPIGKLA
jgi:predicted heme/steroid binding protein